MNRITLPVVIAVLIGAAAVASLVFWLAGPEEPPETAATTEPASRVQASPTPAGESPATPAGGSVDTGAPQPTPVVELDFVVWLDGDLNDLEQPAFESLEAIREAAPLAARALIDTQWLSDPDLHPEEQLALAHIEQIAQVAPDLAEEVAAAPWLGRGEVTVAEAFALDQVDALSAEQPELASTLVRAEWAGDGITVAEQLTFAAVRLVAEEDPAAAQRIAESPEVTDGISNEELAAFTGSDNYFLERLERDFPDVAEVVKGYAWISGGPSASRAPETGPGQGGGGGLLASPLRAGPQTDYERWVLNQLRDLSGLDPELGERAAALPWLADGVTPQEGLAMHYLLWLARWQDIGLARLLLDQPWFRDDPER